MCQFSSQYFIKECARGAETRGTPKEALGGLRGISGLKGISKLVATRF